MKKIIKALKRIDWLQVFVSSIVTVVVFHFILKWI